MITSADFLKWLEIFGVPNNGGGITPGNPYLIKANDLSDVASVPSSRTNLSVPATSSYAGNPNGNVAGALGDFVLDSSSDNQLWLCTTAGNAADAVWSLQTPAGTYLLKANDLSDVDSVPTSRTNLSVPATSIYAGNPNGNVAGALGDFVLDSDADNQLWLCTTAGIAADAVWSLQTPGAAQITVSDSVLFANRITLSDSVLTNLITLSLPTAGQWECNGNVFYNGNSNNMMGTTTTISTASETINDSSYIANFTSGANPFTNWGAVAPTRLITMASPGNIYLIAYAGFSTSTVTACGQMYATKIS